MKHHLMLKPLPAGKLPGWLLRKVLPGSPRDPDILVGPGLGRDAAAIAVGERVVVAKNDPITFASEGGAAHLVEVNANDVACMGATPRWLLVTALLPHGVTPADVLNQFAELRETCRHRSVELIGGHTEIVPGLARPILVGMMLGDASPHELLRPGQARPGDVLLLTKGLAIEGTALLARERADELRERIGGECVRAAARLLDEPGISIVARGGDCAPLRRRSPHCTIPPRADWPARCASWRPSREPGSRSTPRRYRFWPKHALSPTRSVSIRWECSRRDRC